MNTPINPSKLAVRPVPMSVFPTAHTLNEAIENMRSIIPENQWNDVYASLMVYHNTLLKVLNEGTN